MIAVIFLLVAIIVAAVLVGQQRNNKLMAQGKVAKRDISFVEASEIFTLRGATPARVASELTKLNYSDFGATVDVGQGDYRFSSTHGWQAQLALGESDGDTYRYNFSFTGWQTRRGIPWRIDTMNMMLTSVEKMFLAIDPGTNIETVTFKGKR